MFALHTSITAPQAAVEGEPSESLPLTVGELWSSIWVAGPCFSQGRRDGVARATVMASRDTLLARGGRLTGAFHTVDHPAGGARGQVGRPSYPAAISDGCPLLNSSTGEGQRVHQTPRLAHNTHYLERLLLARQEALAARMSTFRLRG